MNFIEAHQILSELQQNWELKANPADGRPGVSVFPKSILPCSKADLVNAFKLFYAVQYRYGNLSPVEHFSYFTLMYKICVPYADDDKIAECVECKKTIRKIKASGFSYRIKNRKALSEAKEKNAQLEKEFSQQPTVGDMKNELEKYIQDVAAIVRDNGTKVRDLPQDFSDRQFLLAELHNQYCSKIYKLVGIPMVKEDLYYFFPMQQLQAFAHSTTDKKMKELFAPYMQYIDKVAPAEHNEAEKDNPDNTAVISERE